MTASTIALLLLGLSDSVGASIVFERHFLERCADQIALGNPIDTARMKLDDIKVDEDRSVTNRSYEETNTGFRLVTYSHPEGRYCSHISFYDDAQQVSLTGIQNRDTWIESDGDIMAITTSFDAWADEAARQNTLAEAPACFFDTPADAATEIVYERALPRGSTETEVPVVVHMRVTRLPHSYLNPNHGWSYAISAAASAGPNTCIGALE